MIMKKIAIQIACLFLLICTCFSITSCKKEDDTSAPAPGDTNQAEEGTNAATLSSSETKVCKTTEELVAVLEEACTNADIKTVRDQLSKDFPAVAKYTEEWDWSSYTEIDLVCK